MIHPEPFTMRQNDVLFVRAKVSVALAILLLVSTAVLADGGIVYQDLVKDPASGLIYDRAPSERNAILEAIHAEIFMQVPEGILPVPIKPRGVPGVVIFDADEDGDLDLFVTNGPGRANSLFISALRETGELVFTDRAEQAGVAAVDMDAAAAAAGDFDNDGDSDLLVTAAPGPARLFENRGDGTFTDITAKSGIGGDPTFHSTALCLGDFNGDGLLDIFLGGAADFSSNTAIFIPNTVEIHNRLLFNVGGNTFVDVTSDSGILTQAGLSPGFETTPSLTHACTAVDYDLDGDTDILTADDQAGVAAAVLGGVDRGVLHFFQNDGTGSFRDVNVETGLASVGAWMGLAVADFDRNGRFDVFGSNLGSYITNIFAFPILPRAYNTRWFLGQDDGTFLDPGVGDFQVTPFSWGTAALDYDNDGDLDVVSHGGLDFGPVNLADNPGIILQNDGWARFTWDSEAASSTDHLRRNVHGLAVGDLDENGFVDIVTVSNVDLPAEVPLVPAPPQGSVFDATAFVWPIYLPTDDPNVVAFNTDLPPLPNGSLSVELSSGGNGQGWVQIEALGTVGLTELGRVNRDGIGAVVRVFPRPGRPSMLPVTAGSSYASQHALAQTFGICTSPRAIVEVLWPGGVRNRIYDVRAGQRILFPEIPCDIFSDATVFEYAGCVLSALDELVEADVLRPGQRARFLVGALRAFQGQNAF